MSDTRVIVACAEQRVFWQPDAEPAKCTDARHEHRQRQVHLHRDALTLPDGSQVIAASFDALDPYARTREPNFGLYLDRRWQPPWPHQRLDWPDFGVPDDVSAVLATLQCVLDRARAGQQVEVGCLGGHGRTGTALACLAVLAGQDPAGAVAWVRANYCPKAVETRAQEEFVTRLRR